jgi:hypothetical protein
MGVSMAEKRCRSSLERVDATLQGLFCMINRICRIYLFSVALTFSTNHNLAFG